MGTFFFADTGTALVSTTYIRIRDWRFRRQDRWAGLDKDTTTHRPGLASATRAKQRDSPFIASSVWDSRTGPLNHSQSRSDSTIIEKRWGKPRLQSTNTGQPLNTFVRTFLPNARSVTNLLANEANTKIYVWMIDLANLFISNSNSNIEGKPVLRLKRELVFASAE